MPDSSLQLDASVDRVYSGFDHAPYGCQYPGELIFVARRRPAS